MPSRRLFMGSAAALSISPLVLASRANATVLNPGQVLSLFDSLPGDKSIKIWAPATDNKPQLLISSNASPQLFVGSAFKTFVLAEALIQADTPDVVKTITSAQLTLDASVWSVDSATFNPPNLSGTVSERTAMEAMIMHSDNTGTDMMLKYAGPDNVRSFIAAAGLKKTAIPDSTRSFFGYLLGASDYKTFTWAELEASGPLPIVNSPLNGVETLASSADDLVYYYSRALHGQFFKNPETLNEFRRILSLGDAIFLVPLPIGASAFAKGGSIDVPGFHCLCVPGGLFFNNRWVYFAFTINWYAAAETDPDTAAAFVSATSQAMTLVFNALSA
nr:serine hydrolase [uncultured Rhodopila sp.]